MSFTLAEVSKHNKRDDAWIVIDNDVYNVTKFINLHPGGIAFLIDNAGNDVTDLFKLYHHPDHLAKYGPKLKVGVLNEAEVQKKKKRPVKLSKNSFGDMIPYGDPSWYQRLNSPYYKPTHFKFRAMVRELVDQDIINVDWHTHDKPPQLLYENIGKMGLLACMHGPPYPTKYVLAPPPEQFDYFHELILYDEIARCGKPSVVGALTNGCAIAVSAIMRFGSDLLKEKVAPDVFCGKKYICLAVSEPNAGSDVANLATRAVKTPDGSGYVVNGCKKWITNGTYADFFVVAVQTKPNGGQKGLSFLLMEKDMPGFIIRKLQIRDSDISGTAFLEFQNVVVPAANLIGVENDGFKYIMHNFNHERFYVTCSAARHARICIEECIKYALRRKTFGKFLHEHQAIRMKIAAMIRAVEQLQAWLEFVTYQMCTMSHEEANLKLGDVICLLKSQASKTMEYCARETTHIFGGHSLHMTSVGKKIEAMVAATKGYAIPAGAEDIMDDFGARAAFRLAMTTAKM